LRSSAMRGMSNEDLKSRRGIQVVNRDRKRVYRKQQQISP